MVSLDMMVVRSDTVLDASVDAETVLMSIDTGQYMALKETSRAIWSRIGNPVSVRDLCADLATAYQTPIERVEADTLAFLDHLEAQGMIELRAA